jgi:hypothetical protein
MHLSPALTCLNKEIGGGMCASPVENTELTVSSGMAALHSVSLPFSSHVVCRTFKGHCNLFHICGRGNNQW